MRWAYWTRASDCMAVGLQIHGVLVTIGSSYEQFHPYPANVSCPLQKSFVLCAGALKPDAFWGMRLWEAKLESSKPWHCQ